MNDKKIKFSNILAVLVIAVLGIFTLKPILNPMYYSFYIFIGMMLFVISNMIFIKINQKFAAISTILSLLLVLVVPPALNIATSPLFLAQSYRDLIGHVKQGNFKKDLEVGALENIRLVDEEMAIAIANKKLGEAPAIGSISKVGDIKIQKIDNKLYWVAPLVHKDPLKAFLNAKEGSRGYVMVSATNPQESRLVQELDGKPIKIKYQPEGFLTKSLDTHTYFIKGVMTKGFTDWTFELNEDGKPYWIATTYRNRIGANPDTAEATGVLVLDAETGDIKEYSIKDAPKWIDRIQPDFLVRKQINYWGKYIKGFLNSVLSEEGVLVATEGTSLVFGNDGESYWYTGLTSSGADDSTVGFVLINTRTKEVTFYNQPGGTETSAMQSAQNKVSNFAGYRSSFPIMYNIFGKPTYISSIKDSAGLLKKVAFVSVEDVSIIGVGDTKEEAYKNYKEALNKTNLKIDTNTLSIETIKGKITRFNSITQDGKTTIYFTIEGNNKIFKSTLNDSSIFLAKVGDEVEVKVEKTDKVKDIDLVEFKNITLK